MRLKLYSLVFFSTLCFYALLAQNSDTIKIQETNVVDNSQRNKAYVVFENDTLFSIATNLGPYSPDDRAQSASDRLTKLADRYKIVADSFITIEKNKYSIISYRNYHLFSVSETDAAQFNRSRHDLATEYLAITKTTFADLIEQNTLTYWLLRIAYTLLAIAGLFLIIFFINKLFKWLDIKLTNYEKGLKRKRKSIFKYLVQNSSGNVFLLISKIIKLALIVFILFFYLPFMFSFLPWTQGLAGTFYGYIATPVKSIINGFIGFIPNLFAIFIIFIIARYFLRILTYISKEIEENKLKINGFHRDWARPTFNLVKILIYALALVFTVQYLPASKAFQGVSIFVGIIFTLGSTSAISNMIAGIVITYMRPFMVGDRVKIGETVGDIVEKNLLVTRLKTVKNEDVTIPNATIINTHLWNYTKNASQIGIILHPTVTIGYDVPSEQVNNLLLSAAKNTKNLTREFKPFVLQKSLNDFYVEYELNVYTKQPEKMAHFYSELHRNILNEFNKAGVEILSPHYSAYRDGNQSTIPETEPVDTTKNPVTKMVDKITGQS